jgi:hypothetical protein
LSVETARKVAIGFTRYAAMATSGQAVALGFDPRDAPAFHRVWRALPWSARMILMTGALAAGQVAIGALQQVGAVLVEAVRSGIRCVAAQEEAVEREVAPPHPLPRLVTPEDAVQDGGRPPGCARMRPGDGAAHRKAGYGS